MLAPQVLLAQALSQQGDFSMVIFSNIGLSGGDLQEAGFSFLDGGESVVCLCLFGIWVVGFGFFFRKSDLFGLGAISEVNLPAWDTGTCFRNKILLHHGALCKTAVQITRLKRDSPLMTPVVAGFFLN